MSFVRNAALSTWRKLPVTWRQRFAQSVLLRASQGLLDPNAARAAADAPWIVVGFLTSPSGLGQAARLAMRALETQGRTVLGVDVGSYFYETTNLVEAPFVDGRKHRGQANVLINVNAPYMPYVLQILGRRFLKQKFVVGYWAWELPVAPDTWRRGLSCCHAIATPSAFVADAMRKLGAGPPVSVVPHPVALDPDLKLLPARAKPVSEEAPFTVVASFSVASGFVRKNPVALIRAFRRAFDGRRDRRLRILISQIQHHEAARQQLEEAAAGDPTVEITYAVFDRPAYWRWYGSPDLFASLHRAEGFGLGLAEAMLLGVPTLATNWSANAEFLDESTSYPVAYTLMPVEDHQSKYESGTTFWAEPDIDDAARQLRRAADNEAERLDKARAARTYALAAFSDFRI